MVSVVLPCLFAVREVTNNTANKHSEFFTKAVRHKLTPINITTHSSGTRQSRAPVCQGYPFPLLATAFPPRLLTLFRLSEKCWLMAFLLSALRAVGIFWIFPPAFRYARMSRCSSARRSVAAARLCSWAKRGKWWLMLMRFIVLSLC